MKGCLMKLAPPIEQYLSNDKPTHSSRSKLASNMKLWSQPEVEELLRGAAYITTDGKIAKKTVTDGLVDTCEGKPLWNITNTKKVLLAVTRKPSKKATSSVTVLPKRVDRPHGPVWTDLENIGTYFGVGKNKIGTWLDQLGLRDYKPVQINESGDRDMLDMANASKEKFKLKIPTKKALERGFANMETIEYTQKGNAKSFDKYYWNLDMVKEALVRAGHPLDTDRKLLHKGRGKNGDIKVETIDDRAKKLYSDWLRLYNNPNTHKDSWAIFNKQPVLILTKVEQLMGRPRYIQDKLYLKKR